jgi:hypothetical protein
MKEQEERATRVRRNALRVLHELAGEHSPNDTIITLLIALGAAVELAGLELEWNDAETREHFGEVFEGGRLAIRALVKSKHGVTS